MKKSITAVVLVLLLYVSPALSAEIDGTWKGTVTGQDGNPMELTFEFKADGTNLHGTVWSHLGGGPFSEGKIKKDKISFVIDAGDFKIYTTGTIVGDEIHLVEKIGENTIELTLKRVKREQQDFVPATVLE